MFERVPCSTYAMEKSPKFVSRAAHMPCICTSSREQLPQPSADRVADAWDAYAAAHAQPTLQLRLVQDCQYYRTHAVLLSGIQRVMATKWQERSRGAAQPDVAARGGDRGAQKPLQP